MERLTIPDEKIEGGVRRTVIDSREVKKNAMTIYWALKKYEDTGLDPDQIRELKERDTAKPVTEVCGVCGEKYECPNCGSGLRDTDVFVGYCKWCGQRLKKWED